MRVISISLLVTSILQGILCDDYIVSVEHGQLSGELLTSVLGTSYYSYKGIPYAKAPLGELRFKAPQELEKWDGVRKATAHGNVCPQYDVLSATYVPGSEDCLFLNVYTPNLTPDSPLPVLFFIHGGAYKFGSGDSSQYSPDFLVSKGIVVVTINYRLDILGFLCLDSKEVPGNAGLKDQIAALKWVQNNIKAFGGDPDSVTVYGNTAGSNSLTYHMTSKLSKGLFKRAIAISGAPSCEWGIPYQPKRRALKLCKSLGYETYNTTEALTFLQGVSVDKLINSAPVVLASEKTTDILFKKEPYSPVIEKDFGDDHVITEDAFDALDNGNINEVDVIFGYNSQEALLLVNLFNASYVDLYDENRELFVPANILTTASPDTILEVSDKIKEFYMGDLKVNRDNMANLISYSSNASVPYHVYRFAKRWLEQSPDKKTYFMKFSYSSGRNYYGNAGQAYGIKGTAHFEDVFYIFNPVALNLPLEENSIEYEMVQNVTTAVANFVKYGDPSYKESLGITWPEFTSDTEAYLNFDDELVVDYRPDGRDMDFWKSIYENAQMKF